MELPKFTYALFINSLYTELFCIPTAYFKEKKYSGIIDTLQLLLADTNLELDTSLMYAYLFPS